MKLIIAATRIVFLGVRTIQQSDNQMNLCYDTMVGENKRRRVGCKFCSDFQKTETYL